MCDGEREGLQHRLEDMSRLNDRLSILHRATMQELARTRHRLAIQHSAVELVECDHTGSLQAAIALAEFLLKHGELDDRERDLAQRIVRAGGEIAELESELVEALRGPS